MTRRIAGLYLLFGAVIVAAMGGSYLHLAAWLVPWMPPGWERLSYMSALAIDGMILAPIMARQIVGGPVPGMALPLAQAVGVVASIYVNTRWGVTARAGTIWADIGVGATLMPVVALIMEHAMRAALAVLQEREARQTKAVPVTPAPRRATVAAPAPAERQADPAAVAERGRAAELAAAEGVSLRTAYRRLAAGKMAGGASA